MKSEVVRLFQTLPHACGYFAERTAQNLVIDPAAAQLAKLYEVAMSKGYRRGGGHVYRPNCNGCQACVPTRVLVDDFQPDRSQRRCLRRNGDLRLDVVKARFTDEYFQLYRRYLNSRHAGGGMDDPDPQDFSQFLFTPWSPTNFLELRLHDRLVAVAVTDCTRSGLSAVYTFFDPDERARSLGTYAILRQIELARQHNVAYVYLGFWIEGHAKMDYKARFQPLQLLGGDGWHEMPQASP